MTLSTKTSLALSIILFLFIIIIIAYFLIYSYEYKLNDYKIFLGLTLVLFLIALLMMIFTLINLINYKPNDSEPIILNTCPDYYYKDKILDSEGKPSTYCKPFIFEGSNNEHLYIIKELQPFTKSYDSIDSDKNYYNLGQNLNAFYDINTITFSDGPNKKVKVLNYDKSNFTKKINLNDLNKIADKTSSKKEYNEGLCACALNLGWNELQHECGAKNLYRKDNKTACSGLSKELHDNKLLETELTDLSGFDYAQYYNNVVQAENKLNNQHFVDLNAIQINLTS
jgi:energy-coupling factor transporter transmembrane protein EcfT